VAGPVVTGMGAWLEAAGLAWRPRPAPPEGIAEVALDVALLQEFCPVPPEAGQPETMVAQWEQFQASPTGENA